MATKSKQLDNLYNELEEFYSRRYFYSSNGQFVTKQKACLDSLITSFKLLPNDERWRLLHEKNWRGNTLLFEAAADIDSFETVLSFYPTQRARLNALKEEGADNNTFLHWVATDPVMLKKILALYPDPENECLHAVLTENKASQTVLHRVVHKLDSLNILLPYLSAALAKYPGKTVEVLKAMNEDGNTALHEAAKHSPKAFDMIFALYPNPHETPWQRRQHISRQRLDALTTKNNKGNTVLHLAAMEQPELLEKILGFYPKKQLLEALMTKNASNQTVFELVAAYAPNSLEKIRPLLPTEKTAQEAVKENRDWDDALTNPESLAVIANTVPEEEFFQAIMGSKDGKRRLHKIVYLLPAELAELPAESLKVIFNTLSEEHCLQVIEALCDNNETLLHKAIYSAECFKAIFDSLSNKIEGQKNRWLEVITAENRKGETVLHRAAPESLKIILENLPIEKRLAALQTLTDNGETVLDIALSDRSSDSLKVILKSLPQDQRLKAVMIMGVRRVIIKDVIEEQRETMLHLAALNQSTHLEVIFKSLSDEDRLTAIKEADSKGHTVFRALQQASPDLINDIISYAVNKLEEKKYTQPIIIQDEIDNILQSLESPELKKNPEIAFKVVQDTCALLEGQMTTKQYLEQAKLIGRNPNKELRTLGKAMITLGVLVTVVSAAILAVATFPFAAGMIVMGIATVGLAATSSVILATGMRFFEKGRNPFLKTSTSMETLAKIKVDPITPIPMDEFASDKISTDLDSTTPAFG